MKYIFRFNIPLYKSYPYKYYKNLARLFKIRDLFAKNLYFNSPDKFIDTTLVWMKKLFFHRKVSRDIYFI
jgi:hypothetical protein